jgi:hypothetical protein
LFMVLAMWGLMGASNAVMDSPCTTLTRTSGAVSGVRRVSAMHKQIAVDLAKSVYQVAELPRASVPGR